MKKWLRSRLVKKKGKDLTPMKAKMLNRRISTRATRKPAKKDALSAKNAIWIPIAVIMKRVFISKRLEKTH